MNQVDKFLVFGQKTPENEKEKAKMTIQEEELQQESRSYAMDRLMEVNPRMAMATYKPKIKLSSPCFQGTDIQKAFEDGYRRAMESLHQTPDREYYGG